MVGMSIKRHSGLTETTRVLTVSYLEQLGLGPSGGGCEGAVQLRPVARRPDRYPFSRCMGPPHRGHGPADPGQVQVGGGGGH